MHKDSNTNSNTDPKNPSEPIFSTAPTVQTTQTVLVLGGRGFIGRHVAQALLAAGYSVIIGTRHPERSASALPAALQGLPLRRARLDKLQTASDWLPLLQGVHAVVNCVGILRQRGAETYERVHHLAPAALAAACREVGITRLLHVSALGLGAPMRSRFLSSKVRGEDAIKRSGLDYAIVRPSLLDGAGGFGAAWMHLGASLPVHAVPADARGRFAALDVGELGEAMTRLLGLFDRADLREVELGGADARTMSEHLAALRAALGKPRAWVIPVPALIARLTAHVCDVFHFSPFSYGHWELLHHDNLPSDNKLAMLLGRTPRRIGKVIEPGLGEQASQVTEGR
jgi:uncharacterized protein YbjT (DUF2867 family)